RDMAKNGTGALTKTIHLFTPPDAYQVTNQQPTGPRFDADAVFNGENRPGGAMLSYVINKPIEKKDSTKSKPVDTKAAKKTDTVPSTKLEVKKDEKPKVKY